MAFSLLAVAGAIGRPGRVIGDGVDLYGTFWFYWWIDRCLTSLTDPSFTDMMFHPLGKDIFAHTGNNFVDAVLAWPVQALLPYPGYQPVWVLVLLAVNGLTFWPLARHLADDTSGPLVVAVHAAAFGSAARNQDLSQRRADRLRMALIAWGVDADRLTAVGFGEGRSRGPKVEFWTRAALTR